MGLLVARRFVIRTILVDRSASAETAPVAFLLLVELAAFGHEPRREGSKGFGQPGQFALDYGAQHQGVADFFNLDILAGLDDGEFLGNPDGKRVAAFEDACEHGLSPVYIQDIHPSWRTQAAAYTPCFRLASMNGSRSPSSTFCVFDASTLVRRSLMRDWSST